MNNLDYNHIKDCTIWPHILRFGSSAIFNYFQTIEKTTSNTVLFGSSAIFNYFQTCGVLHSSLLEFGSSAIFNYFQTKFKGKGGSE